MEGHPGGDVVSGAEGAREGARWRWQAGAQGEVEDDIDGKERCGWAGAQGRTVHHWPMWTPTIDT
jgi:hypothetical protein